MFAWRLSTQLPVFVSYHPDSEVMHINAFSISWLVWPFYAFPRFTVIGNVLRKIFLDVATGIMAVFDWPTELWYSLLTKLLIDIPILLHSNKTLLQHTERSKPHPLDQKLNLLACIISGKNQEQQPFQIIQQSRRPSATKKYDNCIGKWKVFCRERSIDPISTSLDQPIEFLIKIFESGVRYSSVVTVRSALRRMPFK